MNVMAFGTGMRIELGYFNAGWFGRSTLNAITPGWHALVRRPTLRWKAISVSQLHWEERP